MDIVAAIVTWLWSILNSPAGIAMLAGLVGYGLVSLYRWRPAWAAWEGSIIQAVKLAEKTIPDDTPNAGLRRFDEALKFILRIYDERTGRQPPASLLDSLREGISIVHDDLEANKTL